MFTVLIYAMIMKFQRFLRDVKVFDLKKGCICYLKGVYVSSTKSIVQYILFHFSMNSTFHLTFDLNPTCTIISSLSLGGIYPRKPRPRIVFDHKMYLILGTC